PVLHDQGARPRHGAGAGHRGSHGGRNGRPDLGDAGAGRRRRVQDVLSGNRGPVTVTRVLVVDDEPGLRQSLGLLLGASGFAVKAEGDGRRGLERDIALPYELILYVDRTPGIIR